jgi:hypothetical protein
VRRHPWHWVGGSVGGWLGGCSIGWKHGKPSGGDRVLAGSQVGGSQRWGDLVWHWLALGACAGRWVGVSSTPAAAAISCHVHTRTRTKHNMHTHAAAQVLGGVDPDEAEALAVSYVMIGIIVSLVRCAALRCAAL